MIQQPIPPKPIDKVWWLPWLFGLAAMVLGSVSAVLIYITHSPALVAVIVLGMPALFITATRPEYGLLFLVLMTYLRLSDVLIRYHGLPSIFQPYLGFLVGLIAFRWYIYGEMPQNIKRTLFLFGSYALMVAASLIYADDYWAARHAFSDMLKAIIVGFLVVVMLQRREDLRKVVWTLLGAGIIMGSLSVYQYLTGTFENPYWGLAQANVQNIIGKQDDYRIAGPIGDPNFYAQILIVLVPLAMDRLWNEKSLLLRGVAGWAFAVCLLAIVFTFSRGALVSLMIVLAVQLIRRPPSIPALLLMAILVAPLLQFVPESYTERLSTLLDLVPGLGDSQASVTEVSYRGRTSEILAGLYMFGDNPLIGVGIENYPASYQAYSRQLGLDPRIEERHAHSLYVQILAEHGLMGGVLFLFMMWVVLMGLYHGEKELEELGFHDEAGMGTSLLIGLVGYLAAAIFLHNAYPRFFWLLLGIALAFPNVAKNERLARQAARQSAPATAENTPVDAAQTAAKG